jgi:hypothetical protein
MGLSQKLFDEYSEEYCKRSIEITRLSGRFPWILAAASGFPLYTDVGSGISRTYLSIGLALSSFAILIEYVRNHLNLKHIEVILHEHEKHDDFYYKSTLYGAIGDLLFWLRGALLFLAGAIIVYGIYIFRIK